MYFHITNEMWRDDSMCYVSADDYVICEQIHERLREQGRIFLYNASPIIHRDLVGGCFNLTFYIEYVQRGQRKFIRVGTFDMNSQSEYVPLSFEYIGQQAVDWYKLHFIPGKTGAQLDLLNTVCKDVQFWGKHDSIFLPAKDLACRKVQRVVDDGLYHYERFRLNPKCV